MGRKPLNKKRLDSPEIRLKWVEHLMPVYMKNGLRKYTMDDIAKQLGVSKATVYKHFSTQKEIIQEVVYFKVKEIADFKRDLDNKDTPYLERYQQAVKSSTLKMAGISNQFLIDIKELYPDLWQHFQSLEYYAMQRAKDFYAEGIELGILNDHFNPHWLAMTDKIFVLALSDPKFLVENNLTLHQAFQDYFEMKSRGIFK